MSSIKWANILPKNSVILSSIMWLGVLSHRVTAHTSNHKNQKVWFGLCSICWAYTNVGCCRTQVVYTETKPWLKKQRRFGFLLPTAKLSTTREMKQDHGGLSSWQCPVMTHGHMHYKASDMHPILKPVMVQNNADYCQINWWTSFNENSLCCLHTGEPSQSEPWQGGALDMYTRSGLTSFNSCSNPELETVSPLHSHWIRLDLTRSLSHLRQGQSFPCCFPTRDFTWPKWINTP